MSLKITLPDQSIRNYPIGVIGLDIAKDIGDKLYRDVVAIKIDGELKDLTLPINHDATVHLITRQHDDSLEVIRHDAAHALAQAVKEIYPDVQVTIGPAITNGFYYDFHRSEPFTTDDLAQLEQRMHDIVNRDIPIVREEWDRDGAIAFFKNLGEHYKAEIINDIPAGETITLYRQGDFIDLCRGPHLPSTGRLGKAFKLMKVAGAYWRGDSKNVMLQRIYGTAWATEQQLKDHLFQLEEAEKRDHRKLGKQLGLFHLQEEAAGSVFWHPKGWAIYQTLRHYMTLRLRQNNYVEVNTPILVDRSFWEKSGHWDKYREHMFTSEDDDANHTLAMKPMNCPCHVQIFKQGIKSYRDLPLRMAEFGSCHRNEHSGALHGLMRVRAFVQDDAHIFCTMDQISSETLNFCQLLKQVYQDLGFTDYKVRFSDRPDMRVGSDETWDKAEDALRQATVDAGIETVHNPGDGAFYGPKLDFVLKDALGREWQLGTLQVDLNLPERLDANYIDEQGQKCRPVMLHRAVLGSFERFIAILIENYAGKFPLWLAPIQVAIVPITDAHHAYANEIAAQLKQQGIRVEVDLRNEKMNYKIREFSHNKVPVIFIVGQSECDNNSVTLRYHGQQDQINLTLVAAIEKIIAEAQNPALINNLRR